MHYADSHRLSEARVEYHIRWSWRASYLSRRPAAYVWSCLLTAQNACPYNRRRSKQPSKKSRVVQRKLLEHAAMQGSMFGHDWVTCMGKGDETTPAQTACQLDTLPPEGIRVTLPRGAGRVRFAAAQRCTLAFTTTCHVQRIGLALVTLANASPSPVHCPRLVVPPHLLPGPTAERRVVHSISRRSRHPVPTLSVHPNAATPLEAGLAPRCVLARPAQQLVAGGDGGG